MKKWISSQTLTRSTISSSHLRAEFAAGLVASCGPVAATTAGRVSSPRLSAPRVIRAQCLFGGGSAGKEKKRRHSARCRGQCIHTGWQPAPDGTLHCPLCKTPGFNYETQDTHLTREGRECDGSRDAERDGRNDKEEQLSWAGLKVFCLGCKKNFLGRQSFARHACGALYDPIWLGETTHPDTSKPYIV